MSVIPGEKDGIYPKLGWASLVCGILSWILSPFIPFGLDAAAIVLGAIALMHIKKTARRDRIIAHLGLWSGVLKALVMLFLIIWLITAFMLNPVAH